MRPPKKLVDHLRDGTFRPERHATLLLGEDLPLNVVGIDAPATRRVWDRMRTLQAEYRQLEGLETRRQVAVEFSKAANDLAEFTARGAPRDRREEIAGLAELRADWGEAES